MKKILFVLLSYLTTSQFIGLNAQITNLAPTYSVIDIGGNGYGDYTRSLILLHEVYNNTLIDKNFAIGTITAMRGATSAFDRIDVAQVNTSSAYNMVNGSVVSMVSLGAKWTLKTAMYNGKKYIALDIPYSAAYHNWGYKFAGFTLSTGESMKCISYEVSGAPVNQDVLSNIQDFTPTLDEIHDVKNYVINGNQTITGGQTVDGNFTANGFVSASMDTRPGEGMDLTAFSLNGNGYQWRMYTAAPDGGWGVGPRNYEIWEYPENLAGGWASRRRFVIENSDNHSEFGIFYIKSNGNVGIGTTNPQNALDVKGTIHASRVIADPNTWSDFVFAPNYQLRPLAEVEQYIKANNKLPEIPSAKEVEKDGVSLGDMQAKLLQKVEELTLYVIELKKENEALKKSNNTLKQESLERFKELTYKVEVLEKSK